ncbi:PK beta-barrel-protein domain-containing protein-like protein [Massarina eburnea CBS 473.64]|uniref:PK beta-barrel-protein domain-containing protein-like protein n=1 Tax=Massarina eburnea CBS 473.64 TaxID=1395130 RepID=A0A6A6RM30_9PLEO|nr:PK beta-barrel-protein domain-containing protein-like protein [Massarina eburnea CBS 473.64]
MSVLGLRPPPGPDSDPSTWTHPLPFSPFTIAHLRTGKIKPVFSKPGMMSAIYKTAHAEAVQITMGGIQGDEHAYEPHRHPDKAVHQYCSAHYSRWQSELPESAHLFRPGAFGENLFSDQVSERDMCIGDRIGLGPEVVLELSEPRKPCYKLNHRFEVKDMAARTQTKLRTGWLYRVITPGTVHPNATFRLIERPHPEWTVARVMHYMFLERDNMTMMREIVKLPLGQEIMEMFEKRLQRGKAEDQMGRMYGGEEDKMDTWNSYRIIEKRRETSTVTAFVLASVDAIHCDQIAAVEPGSHVRVKLGGKLVRAYSVVGGTNQRFTLGIALDPESRGGSKFLHEQTNVDDILTVGRITPSFPLVKDADQHIIIAGGIGITAFLAALAYLESTTQNYTLHFAVAKEVPFKADIDKLGPRAKIYNSSLCQRLDLSAVLSRADTNTHIYICGPPRLASAVSTITASLSIPDSQVHVEAFTVTASGDPFSAELKQSGKMVEVDGTESLLDALRKVGLDVASSCEVGNCGTCRVDVCGGRVEHRGTGLVGDDKDSGMLACVSRGIGKIVLDI